MCGIAGAVAGSGFPFSKAALQAMTDCLAHRGPDADGQWIEDGVFFGQRRLSILDLSEAGHQPMLSHNGRFVITFNGEIYNHLSLRAELEAQGVINWRGHSDTETLIEALALWGAEKTLPKLNGMFAFALWDRQSKTLTLARDPFGEKPLLYCDLGRSILFASEFRALEKAGGIDVSPSPERVALYLRRGYVPAPFTISSNASKLMPGSMLVWRQGEPAEISEYWSVTMAAQRGRAAPLSDPQEALAILDELLTDAVRLRLISDVSLGALLSGGIDSSIIVALMQKISSKPVRTFSIGFEDKGVNEAPHAKAVAAHLGTEHTEQYLTDRDVANTAQRMGEIYDEPFADASQVPTYLVSALARRDVTVALTGDGGDELFAGYARYRLAPGSWRRISRLPFRNALSAIISGAPDPVIKAAETVLRPFIPRGINSANLAKKIRDAAPLMRARNFDEFYLGYLMPWHDPARLLLDKTVSEPSAARMDTPDFTDELDRMTWWDSVNYLSNDLLTKVDRASMAVSLEGRIPLLDTRIAEFSWRLPAEMKWKDGVGKWILRQLLYKYVPESLVDRPKMGFSVPLDHWLRGPLKEWAEDLLSEDRLRRQGLFDAAEVSRVWHAFKSGGSCTGTQMWGILMFQAWSAARGG